LVQAHFLSMLVYLGAAKSSFLDALGHRFNHARSGGIGKPHIVFHTFKGMINYEFTDGGNLKPGDV
jgi:hypothetical protein